MLAISRPCLAAPRGSRSQSQEGQDQVKCSREMKADLVVTNPPLHLNFVMLA
jgi:hypothetical protein